MKQGAAAIYRQQLGSTLIEALAIRFSQLAVLALGSRPANKARCCRVARATQHQPGLQPRHDGNTASVYNWRYFSLGRMLVKNNGFAKQVEAVGSGLAGSTCAGSRLRRGAETGLASVWSRRCSSLYPRRTASTSPGFLCSYQKIVQGHRIGEPPVSAGIADFGWSSGGHVCRWSCQCHESHRQHRGQSDRVYYLTHLPYLVA